MFKMMNCAGFVDGRQAYGVYNFSSSIENRTFVGTVPSFGVVEQVGVVEHIDPRFGLDIVDPLHDSLALEQLEEAIHRRVVVTVSMPAHTAHDAARIREDLPIFASEMTALFRVQERGGFGLAALPKGTTLNTLAINAPFQWNEQRRRLI